MRHARPLDPKGDRWTPSGKTKVIGSVAIFDINGVRPGRYFFSPEGPQAAVTYFKRIECDGQDHSARPLEIKAGDLAINCKLTFARDSGTITGQILHDGRPVSCVSSFAIPEAKESRSGFDHLAFSDPTKRNGRFEMRGIIPEDYLVFAVPTKSAREYILGLDFDDRIYASAQHLTIKSHENTIIALEATSQKPGLFSSTLRANPAFTQACRLRHEKMAKWFHGCRVELSGAETGYILLLWPPNL
jgi:hypothetical protein